MTAIGVADPVRLCDVHACVRDSFIAGGKSGAVTIQQRFGGALNLLCLEATDPTEGARRMRGEAFVTRVEVMVG